MAMILFDVHGKPATQGSKRPFIGRRKDGSKFAGLKEDNPRLAGWRQDVAAAAIAEFGPETPLLTGPIHLTVTFELARPKAHYGTGRNAGKLKASAPRYHTQTPDLTKLLRALEDALSGVIWRDDSQVYATTPRKEWSRQNKATVGVRQAELESEADDDTT